MNWLVLYIKSRAEKKVADELQANGFSVFCPLKTEISQWSDRKKKIQRPYFSSYVFVQSALNDRRAILETPGVVNFVYWLGKPAIIKEEEMQNVISFFEQNKHIAMSLDMLNEGKEVSIQQGAFKGSKGLIIKKTKRWLTLEIASLGLKFKVQVAKNTVQPIEVNS